MTSRTRQAALTLVLLAAALCLAAFLLRGDAWRDPERPREAVALASWLAAHPADWLAASALSDAALDTALPDRGELWRATHALAETLAPRRPNTAAGFVRAGLFHWYELGPRDRQAVLEAAVPLMADRAFFARMHEPLWRLTRDFAYLRRVAPRDVSAYEQLRDLAAANGLFADYRALREAVRRERLRRFHEMRSASTPPELLNLLPARLTAADEPLVRAILEELDRRPYDAQQVGTRIEELAQYAIDHRIQPLSALSPLVAADGKLSDVTRARLALVLGDLESATRIELTDGVLGAREWLPYYLDRVGAEEARGDGGAASTYRTRAALSARDVTQSWTNLCGTSELCATASRIHEGPLRVTVAPAQTDEIAPYVEIFVDDRLVAEAEVPDERTFDVAGAGRHRVEVRLVNRHMKSGIQRRVRLS